jgi:formylglycine-generating enzyme required for sulfatase activity
MSTEGAAMKTVFISYSSNDRDIAAKVRAALEAKGIAVTIDSESLAPGGDIRAFIDKSIRETNVTLSIVSESSLASDWVALETVDSFEAEKYLEGKRFIGCYVDERFFDRAFVIKAVDKIDMEIKELEKLIRSAARKKLDPTNLQTQKSRKYKLRNNLPKILDRLNGSLTLDIREPEFEKNLQRIIDEISKIPEIAEDSKENATQQNTSNYTASGPGSFAGNNYGTVNIGPITINNNNGKNDAQLTRSVTFEEFRAKYIEIYQQRARNDSHQLDERFVNLTLMIDKGEKETNRWDRQSLKSIAEIIEKNEHEYPVMVILGAPGSGKSTILRRLEQTYIREQIEAGGDRLCFFVPLNRYKAGKGENPVTPLQFLESRWAESFKSTGWTLESVLTTGKVLLLLDAVNEIQHRSSEEYGELIGLWREFAIDQKSKGNRIIFTCRTLDYSQLLSSAEMRVPNVDLQPLTPEKTAEFLKAYLPERHEEVFQAIKRDGTLDFYNNPYFLSLLCQQIGEDGAIPKGRASLFTGYVRQAMQREMDSDLFKREKFLPKYDREMLILNRWESAFQLPDFGPLPEKMSNLAYEMQESGERKENKQVSIGIREAIRKIGAENAESIIDGGIAMKVLDRDVARKQLTYHHQLLQEYFAGRRLATEPKPELVRVEWRASEVRPGLAETIAKLAVGDPLPRPGQTGWEETTLAALPMTGDPEGYIRRLMEENLPLAARCAISAEVVVKEELKEQIRAALIGRTQDMKADLRARIAAGEALGLIGDSRWNLLDSHVGKYLLPPMVQIPAGHYPIGASFSIWALWGQRTGPRHKVRLEAFEIGVFPVTNAEYARFIEAGGYEEERWWETGGAKRWLWWLREGETESKKQFLREHRIALQKNWTDEEIRALPSGPQQIQAYLWRRNSSDEEFERQLAEWFPGGFDRQPDNWDDSAYNNPLQPVVGVSWYEARAYCNWLSEATGQNYRLLTEVEYEAAARGRWGRRYSFGWRFDSSRCNTVESHIERPTPVGIFDNRTPEGAFDLTGNVWTWTTTIYNNERFRYPYNAGDGREELEDPDGGGVSGNAEYRVVRGGSWCRNSVDCRSVGRYRDAPGNRGNSVGFRLSRTLPLALLPLRAE